MPGQGSTLAWADTVGVVVRGAVDAPVASPALTSVMSDVLGKQGLQPVDDPFAHARAQFDRGAVPAERLAGFNQVINLVRQGWQAYVAVDTARAMDQLGQARQAALAVLDLDGGLTLYADVVLRLGAVELQIGQVQAAALDFRLARALDPDREVSIAAFAPDVVKSFDSAQVAEVPMTTLTVTSEPAAARIELDGRYLGPAPVTVEVAVGQHIVIVRQAGYRSQASELVLTETGPVRAELRLERDGETSAITEGG